MKPFQFSRTKISAKIDRSGILIRQVFRVSGALFLDHLSSIACSCCCCEHNHSGKFYVCIERDGWKIQLDKLLRQTERSRELVFQFSMATRADVLRFPGFKHLFMIFFFWN